GEVTDPIGAEDGGTSWAAAGRTGGAGAAPPRPPGGPPPAPPPPPAAPAPAGPGPPAARPPAGDPRGAAAAAGSPRRRRPPRAGGGAPRARRRRHLATLGLCTAVIHVRTALRRCTRARHLTRRRVRTSYSMEPAMIAGRAGSRRQRTPAR